MPCGHLLEQPGYEPLPLRVFNMGKVGVLLRLMLGEEDGTLINGGQA